MSTPTVNRRRAAELLGLAPSTLRKWSCQQPPRGPKVAAKLGDSPQARTLYRVDELERWQADPVAYETRRNREHHDHRRDPRR